MNFQIILQKLNNKKNLTAEEMTQGIQTIMQGKATSEQMEEFLLALNAKGETVTEIAAAAKVIRQLVVPVHFQDPHLVDLVGTGGDQAHIFNVSTTSAFVVAAAGGKVAKHNNRAVSSRSGSADLLEIAGINPTLTPQQIEQCLKKVGIGFMFAPAHHLSWKHIMPTRRKLGVRTIFNLLGPLVNPANVPNLLAGVSHKKWVEPFAKVFQELGNNHVLIVHSEDGLDEISIGSPTFVAELKNNTVKTFSISPEQYGLKSTALDNLRVNNAQESLVLMQSVLNNEPGPARDIVLLNAGAAIYAANLAKDIADGITQANKAIESGKAKQKFIELREFTSKMQ